MVILHVEYKGEGCIVSQVDKLVEETINKKIGGSGYFFTENVRDLEFFFQNKKDADVALEKLQGLKKTAKIKGFRSFISYIGKD
jgi:hypothetical protein